jgi:hypothetical protein
VAVAGVRLTGTVGEEAVEDAIQVGLVDSTSLDLPGSYLLETSRIARSFVLG